MKNINQYQTVQVMTADRVRIIIMLYEGVIRFNNCARKAIEDKDIASRGNFINRSIAILSELDNSLNMEQGGEIAANLSKLYDFSIQQLTGANLHNSTAPIDVVNRIMTDLKSGWESIATDKPGQSKDQKVMGMSYGI